MRGAILVALTCMFCVIGLGQDQTDSISTRKLAYKVDPQYPALARASHVAGNARVLAHVNANGKVDSVQILGGHPLLAQAAVAAIKNWRWEPSIQPTEETVVVKFTLPE